MNKLIRNVLCWSGLLVAVGSLSIWGMGGFRRGWTQTQIPVEQVDEITGIEYTTYVDGFRAGVEVPAVGLLLAVVLMFTSWAMHRRSVR